MSGLRQRLQNGELLLGQMVLELFTPGVGPMLAACGLDFVLFDMEHGRCDIALLAEMIASCRGSDIVPLARVPDVNFSPLSRVLDLGARGVMVPRASFFAHTNEETLVILLLETEKAFENLDAIVSVPGVDVAWIGHYDLTVSMGIPAQFSHPRFLAAMDALVAACRKHGVAPGFLPPSPESALHWIDKGFRILSLGSDIGLFQDAVRGFRTKILQRGDTA